MNVKTNSKIVVYAEAKTKPRKIYSEKHFLCSLENCTITNKDFGPYPLAPLAGTS